MLLEFSELSELLEEWILMNFSFVTWYLEFLEEDEDLS